MKPKLVLLGAVLSFAIAATAWFALRNPGGSNAPPTTASTAAFMPSSGPAPVAHSPLHDTWLLKPPAGAKVALVEFDDLECPACAHALPIVHAAAEHYAVSLVHRDFPLTEIHTWSFDAAVTARYLQDKVSPAAAEAFRRDVFAGQTQIANKDDLQQFTGRWFHSHALLQPFVIDPDGSCQNEVRADRALGDRMGILYHGTPCIFVVTQASAVVVDDLNQLDHILQSALTQTAAAALRGKRPTLA